MWCWSPGAGGWLARLVFLARCGRLGLVVSLSLNLRSATIVDNLLVAQYSYSYEDSTEAYLLVSESVFLIHTGRYDGTALLLQRRPPSLLLSSPLPPRQPLPDFRETLTTPRRDDPRRDTHKFEKKFENILKIA